VTQPPVGAPTCYRHPDRETYITCQRCGRPICPDCMRDAAVGFHCPTCVAEGVKETRQGRTAYGGTRPTTPTLTSIVLIALNAAVWLAVLVTGWQSSALVDRIALTPVGRCLLAADADRYFPSVTDEQVCGRIGGTEWVPGVADGAYWQLLTSAFAHVEVWHIGFNMLVLWMLGPQLELVLGRARFLALYLVSALAGGLAVYWLSGETSATLGASGAIYGLMGALLVVALKVGGDVRGVLTWLGINVVISLVLPVSWQGHLGGLLGGLAVAALMVFAPRERRAVVQWSGVGALTALLVAGIVARTLVLA